MQSKYDVVVIGAGFSGLAAAIRLADFKKSVLLLEAHTVPGGLNSYYYRRPGSTLFNTGLHAFTNFDASNPRWGLGFVCRNLGIAAGDLKLGRPIAPMRVVSADFDLEFESGAEAVYSTLSRVFGLPRPAWDRFHALLLERNLEPAMLDRAADEVLAEIFPDSRMRASLRMPVLLYGGFREGDIPFRMFVIIFRSLFLDGYGSPPSIKHVLDLLVARYREAGGEVRYRQKVARIERDGTQGALITLADGREIQASAVISTIGRYETGQLCGDEPKPDVGTVISAVETTLEFGQPLKQLGVDHTLVFSCTQSHFDWHMPGSLSRFHHYTISAADMFDCQEGVLPHHLRIGGYQDGRRWLGGDMNSYAGDKEAAERTLLAQLRVVFPRLPLEQALRTETMTPRTVLRYTGHYAGGIYGGPEKNWDGRTNLSNVFLAGNDRGGIGVVGAMVSGILAANFNVLLKS